jgi:hypothetical protein
LTFFFAWLFLYVRTAYSHETYRIHLALLCGASALHLVGKKDLSLGVLADVPSFAGVGTSLRIISKSGAFALQACFTLPGNNRAAGGVIMNHSFALAKRPRVQGESGRAVGRHSYLGCLPEIFVCGQIPDQVSM